MDSQEKALLENATDDTSKKTYKSKEEILRRATDIVAENETPDKEEIDNLKTQEQALLATQNALPNKKHIWRMAVILTRIRCYPTPWKRRSRHRWA